MKGLRDKAGCNVFFLKKYICQMSSNLVVHDPEHILVLLFLLIQCFTQFKFGFQKFLFFSPLLPKLFLKIGVESLSCQHLGVKQKKKINLIKSSGLFIIMD